MSFTRTLVLVVVTSRAVVGRITQLEFDPNQSYDSTVRPTCQAVKIYQYQYHCHSKHGFTTENRH